MNHEVEASQRLRREGCGLCRLMKGEPPEMRRLLLTVLVVGCAGAVNVGSAQAIADCGTITASTTLTADCAAPLVVGASGITVNLGGHSVLCNGSPFVFDGIEIPDGVSSSTVMNGSVRGGTGTC